MLSRGGCCAQYEEMNGYVTAKFEKGFGNAEISFAAADHEQDARARELGSVLLDVRRLAKGEPGELSRYCHDRIRSRAYTTIVFTL